MALINCKECGKEVSDSAEFCPHCGFKCNHEENQSVGNTENQQQNIVEQQVQTEIQETIQTQVNGQIQSETQVQNIQQQVQNNIQQPEQNIFQQQAQGEFNSKINQFNPKSFMKNKPATASIGIVIIAIIVGVVIATSVFNKVQESKRPVKVDISMTEWDGYVDYILEDLGLDFDLVTAGANCYTGVKKSEFHTEKYGVLHTEFSYCKSNKRQVFRVYNDENEQPLRDPKPGELPTFDRYGEKTSSGRNNL